MVWGLAWSFPPGNTLLPGKSTAKVAKSVQIAGTAAWEMPAEASDIAAIMLVFIFMFLFGLVGWVVFISKARDQCLVSLSLYLRYVDVELCLDRSGTLRSAAALNCRK